VTKAAFKKARLPRVDDAQWARLAQFFVQPREAMPHVIGNAGGISYRQANALMLAMCTDGIAALYWLVFHNCEEFPVARRPFEDGMVLTRWHCPECGRDVEPSDLRFAVECKTSVGVAFE
jgi:hypothetical protein